MRSVRRRLRRRAGGSVPARFAGPAAGAGCGGAELCRRDADLAVAVLYAAHYRALIRLAALLVSDARIAEEVVQDAFVAMHGAWRQLRDGDEALSYLRRTVVSRSRSRRPARPAASRHCPAGGRSSPIRNPARWRHLAPFRPGSARHWSWGTTRTSRKPRSPP